MTIKTGPTQQLKEPSPHPGRDLTLLESFKGFEFKVFKVMHKIVMADQGIPTLKKRGFTMPGSRKILETSERDKLNSKSFIQRQQSFINSPINSPTDLQQQSSISHTKSLDKSKMNPTPQIAVRTNASPLPERSVKNETQRSTANQQLLSQDAKNLAQDQEPKKSEILSTTPGIEDGLSNNSTILDKNINNSVANNENEEVKVQAVSGMHVLQTLNANEVHIPRIQPPKPEKGEDEIADDQTEVAKSIGFEDLEGPLNAMIQKGFSNSFLVLENFENMKADFRIQKEELLEVIESKILSFKVEIRDSLQQQLQFIEEQGFKHERQMYQNNQMIQAQDLKIELMSQRQQQNIIDHYNNYQNTGTSYAQQSETKKNVGNRRLKSAAKTAGHHSRNNTAVTMNPQVDIEGLLSFRKYEGQNAQKQEGGTQYMNLRSSSDSFKAMANSISVTDVAGQQKYWQDWITEALKLQNILNNQMNSQITQNRSIIVNLHNQISPSPLNLNNGQILIEQNNIGLTNPSNSIIASTEVGANVLTSKIYGDRSEQHFQTNQQSSMHTNMKGASQKNEDPEVRTSVVNLSIAINVDDQQNNKAGPLANTQESVQLEEVNKEAKNTLANQNTAEPVIANEQIQKNKDFESPTVQAVISDIMNQPNGIQELNQQQMVPNYNQNSDTHILSPSTVYQENKNDLPPSHSNSTARQQQQMINFYPSLIDCPQVISLIDRIIENCESINRQKMNPFDGKEFSIKNTIDSTMQPGQNDNVGNQGSIFTNKRLNDSQKRIQVDSRYNNQSTKLSSNQAQFGLGKYLQQQKHYQSPSMNRVRDSPDGNTKTINLQGVANGYTPPLQMLNTIGGSNFAGTYPTGIGLPTFQGETLRSTTTIGGETIRQMRMQPNSTLQNPVNWGILQTSTLTPGTLQQSGQGNTQYPKQATRGIYTHVHQQIRPQSSKIQLGRRIVKTSMTKPLPNQSVNQ